MSQESLPARLRTLSVQLRQIATEYNELKFTAGEQAMTWKLGIVVEEDGSVGIWCDQEGCLLDGHNSQIAEEVSDLTVFDLLNSVIMHIEHNQERVDEYASDPQQG